MEINTILICGGGNAAHALIPILRKQFKGKICLYLPLQNEFNQFQHLLASNGQIHVNFDNETFLGRPSKVSNLPKEVCKDADLILLPLPAFAHEPILKKMIPFFKKNILIGAIPARGGFEFSAYKILEENNRKDITIFGMQTLPWACRIKEYASRVEILGKKNSVDVAAFPHNKVFEISKELTHLLSININALPNMITLTLANVGQIVHPGIMYGLFKGNEDKKYCQHDIPLFYQGVKHEIAEILQNMSDEIQKLVSILTRQFKQIDVSHVLGLKDWLLKSYQYDIEDSSTLERCFVTNHAYHGLKAPMKKSINGYYKPDFTTRYLAEDVPFGLIVTYAIAYLAGVKMPVIEQVIKKASEWMEKEYLINGEMIGKDIKSTRIPQNYGFNSLNEILKF